MCRVSEKCLGGVWGLVSDFEYCLGGYDVQAIHRHPIRLILISRSCLVMAKKCPIGGVWKGCLDDSRGYDVPALVNIQLDASWVGAVCSEGGL